MIRPPAHRGDFKGPLFETVCPELYRKNAFGVTGLGVRAGTREVRRHCDRLRVLHQLGQESSGSKGTHGARRSPSFGELEEAGARLLHDPERRLLDELFWVWPDGGGAIDEAVNVLRGAPTDEAFEWWTAAERNRGSAVAAHNLAVLQHGRALEIELASGEGRRSDVSVLDALWREAIQAWGSLVADDAFWDLLEQRIREVGDPRIPTERAQGIRAELPVALASINAQLAVRAADHRQADEVRRQIGLLGQWGVEPSVVDELLWWSVGPVGSHIELLCQTCEQETARDATQADRSAARLSEQAVRVFSRVDAVIPATHPSSQGLHDQVAGQIRESAVRYYNVDGDRKVASDLLNDSLSVARGRDARQRITADLRTVDQNVLSELCWFCGERLRGRAVKPVVVPIRRGADYARTGFAVDADGTVSPVGTSGRRSIPVLRSIPVPRCFKCARGHALQGPFPWVVAIVALLASYWGSLAGGYGAASLLGIPGPSSDGFEGWPLAAGVLTFVVVLVMVLLLGRLSERLLGRIGRLSPQPLAHTNAFPHVRALSDAGWKPDQTPGQSLVRTLTRRWQTLARPARVVLMAVVLLPLDTVLLATHTPSERGHAGTAATPAGTAGTPAVTAGTPAVTAGTPLFRAGACVRPLPVTTYAGLAPTTRFEAADCGDKSATAMIGKIVPGLSLLEAPDCPDETDSFLKLSEQLGGGPEVETGTACIVNLSPPHPGDGGAGGGVLRVGDCFSGYVTVDEQSCDRPGWYGRIIGRGDSDAVCPRSETLETVKLHRGTRPVLCLGPEGKVAKPGDCVPYDPDHLDRLRLVGPGVLTVPCRAGGARITARAWDASECPSTTTNEVTLPGDFRPTLCLQVG